MNWLKLKRPMDTLDVVVIGAEWGHGKRRGVLSDVTFGVRVDGTDEFVAVGKAYSGLTDAEIAQMTQLLLDITITDRGHFRTVRPEIVLEVSADPALTDIVVGRYDAGIRLGHRVARDMIAVRVSDDLRVVVVASPDYLARHPRPAKPQDLHAHNCIRLRFPSGAFAPWRFAIRGKVVEIEVEGSLIASEAGLLVQAALGGAGVLYVLEEFAAPMIATGQLVPLLETWIPTPSEGFFLYYPSRRQNPAPLRALVDFLRTNLKARTGSAQSKQRIISAKQPMKRRRTR